MCGELHCLFIFSNEKADWMLSALSRACQLPGSFIGSRQAGGSYYRISTPSYSKCESVDRELYSQPSKATLPNEFSLFCFSVSIEKPHPSTHLVPCFS